MGLTVPREDQQTLGPGVGRVYTEQQTETMEGTGQGGAVNFLLRKLNSALSGKSERVKQGYLG